MTFPLTVYLLSFFGAGLASFSSLPLWRAWCRRVNLVDEPGARKTHAAPIPLAGGFAVLTGLLLPLLIGLTMVKPGFSFTLVEPGTIQALDDAWASRRVQLLAILTGAIGMTILGWWDDRVELRPGAKFLGQLLIAALTAAGGVRITLFIPSIVFSYTITILWILSVTNALNFMDNMNGLCAGLGTIIAGGFALEAARRGQYLVASLSLLVSGASAGFLPYNFPRATAFLGDAGSHLVGYLLSVLAILPHFYTASHPKVLAVFSPLFILGVPLADLVWVVVLRSSLGRPFYVGDSNHFSHWLVRIGLSPVQAVAVIWFLAAAFVAAGLFWS